MKKYSKWALVTALVLAVVTGAAVAQKMHREGGQWGGGMGMGMHGGMMGPGMMGHLARYLDLSDAQKAQIKSMWEAQKPAAMPLIQQLANGHKQLLAATANGKFDQGQVQTIANQQAQTLAQLLVAKERLESDIYNKVLTPDQRLKADQLKQKQAQHIDMFLQHLANPGQNAQQGPGK